MSDQRRNTRSRRQQPATSSRQRSGAGRQPKRGSAVPSEPEAKPGEAVSGPRLQTGEAASAGTVDPDDGAAGPEVQAGEAKPGEAVSGPRLQAGVAASEPEVSPDDGAAGPGEKAVEPASDGAEEPDGDAPAGRPAGSEASDPKRRGTNRSKAGRGRKKKRGKAAGSRGTWTGDVQLPNGGLALADRDGVLIQYAPPKVAAGLRYIVARLQRQTEGELPKRTAFTSTLSGEGVSVMARSFATVLGVDTGRRVCLVDLNWWTFDRRPYRRSEEIHGLYEVLWMDKPLDAVLIETASPQVTYLPAGSAPRQVRPTLAQHPRLREVLAELAERFDHLVLDLPAVTATSDGIALSQLSDQVVFVVRQGVASRGQIRSALGDLGDVRPVAAVLNQTRSSIPKRIRKLLGL